MKRRFLIHQDLVRLFIILPTQLTFIICLLTFFINDFYETLRHQVHDIERVKEILAKDVADSRSPLHQRKIDDLLKIYPEIENVAFITNVNHASQINNTLSPLTILFDDYLSFSQPVLLEANTVLNPNRVQQVYGYINTTLNLSHIRRQWLHNMWLPCLVALIVDLLFLWYVLHRLHRLIPHANELERINQQVLADQSPDLQPYLALQEGPPKLLIEQTLLHSLTRQANLQTELDQLKNDAQQLQSQQLEQIQQFSSFQNLLTHEFKTTLEHVTTGVELLKNHYLNEEQLDATQIIDLSVQTSEAKLDQILQVIRIERGQTGVDLTLFNPGQLLTDLIATYQPFAEQKDLALVAKIYHADYQLEGDADKISTIVASFIDNAIKFTEQGKVVVSSQLQHFHHRLSWTIQIQDTGIGISKKQLDQLFSPFIESEMTPATLHHPHSNALFLVKKLADLIGATIEVTSTPNHGTLVTVAMILTDWRDRNERKWLKDKRLAIWQNQRHDNQYFGYLMSLGGQVQVFEQTLDLLDQLIRHPFDALLICPSIDFAQVNALLRQLRAQEISYHTIVIYYHQGLSSREMAALQLNGIDYLEKIEAADNGEPLSITVQRLINYIETA